jgi:hypothetical protein
MTRLLALVIAAVFAWAALAAAGVQAQQQPPEVGPQGPWPVRSPQGRSLAANHKGIALRTPKPARCKRCPTTLALEPKVVGPCKHGLSPLSQSHAPSLATAD